MALKNVKYGDVFELATTMGMAYFQCVKETPVTESEIIRIFPGVYKDVISAKLDELAKQQEIFFVQFPVKYGVRKNVIKFVGNFNVPENTVVPKYYRDKHIVKGEFISWHIIDIQTLKIESVRELSEEHRKLSPAGMWNDTLLAERIAEGWTPEKWV